MELGQFRLGSWGQIVRPISGVALIPKYPPTLIVTCLPTYLPTYVTTLVCTLTHAYGL